MKLSNTLYATAILFGTVFMLYGNKQLISQANYKRDIAREQIRSGTLGK